MKLNLVLNFVIVYALLLIVQCPVCPAASPMTLSTLKCYNLEVTCSLALGCVEEIKTYIVRDEITYWNQLETIAPSINLVINMNQCSNIQGTSVTLGPIIGIQQYANQGWIFVTSTFSYMIELGFIDTTRCLRRQMYDSHFHRIVKQSEILIQNEKLKGQSSGTSTAPLIATPLQNVTFQGQYNDSKLSGQILSALGSITILGQVINDEQNSRFEENLLQGAFFCVFAITSLFAHLL